MGANHDPIQGTQVHLAMSPHKSMPIPHLIKTGIAPSIGLDPTGLTVTPRPPLDFQSNRLYDIRAGGHHFIAKEYLKPDELAVAPLREYKALCLLAPLDIAPQPIFYDPALAPLVIYEYLEGEMWDRRPVTAAGLNQLVEVWLKINALPADWFSRGFERPLPQIALEFHRRLETYLEWAAVEYQPGKRAAENCLELLESRPQVVQELADRTPVLCFCRADPRFANVIQRPDGRLGLVDWEDSGLRDPARDVADVITHPNQEDLLNWKEWQAFVQPYLKVHRKIDPDIARRMHLYLAIFPLFWLTVILQRGLQLASTGGLRGWMINGLPGNERLRRYLARASAWPEMDYREALEKLGEITFFPRED